MPAIQLLNQSDLSKKMILRDKFGKLERLAQAWHPRFEIRWI
jgi:hypothetical protein